MVRVGGKLPKANPKPNGLEGVVRAMASPRFIVFSLMLLQLISSVLRNEKSLEAFLRHSVKILSKITI